MYIVIASCQNPSLTHRSLKTGPIRCSETSVPNYKPTLRNIPDNRRLLLPISPFTFHRSSDGCWKIISKWISNLSRLPTLCPVHLGDSSFFSSLSQLIAISQPCDAEKTALNITIIRKILLGTLQPGRRRQYVMRNVESPLRSDAASCRKGRNSKRRGCRNVKTWKMKNIYCGSRGEVKWGNKHGYQKRLLVTGDITAIMSDWGVEGTRERGATVWKIWNWGAGECEGKHKKRKKKKKKKRRRIRRRRRRRRRKRRMRKRRRIRRKRRRKEGGGG